MTEPTDRFGKLIERAGASLGEREGAALGDRRSAAAAQGGLRASALAGWPSRFAAASTAPARFAIGEVPFVTQINVRGDPADAAFMAALRSALGHDLPTQPNVWAGTLARMALCLGPDEWIVTAPEGRNETTAKLLRNLLRGVHCSVSDVSAGRCVIEISGKHARAVLAKGCAIDLHAKAFAPPRIAQTLLAKAQVLLQCVDSRPTLRLYVRLSFAAYMAEWLLDAAAEFSASRDLDSDRIAARFNSST